MLAFLVGTLIACTLATDIGGAASSAVNVQFTVASATEVNTTGCSPSTQATSFGDVIPNIGVVTKDTCNVTFGSTNDTSNLRISQSDKAGKPMFKLTDGTLDSTFDSDGYVATGMTTINDAVVDSAGNIYVVGMRTKNMAVAKYLPNGNLDTSWGTMSGVTEYNSYVDGSLNCNDEALTADIDSSGRVVVGGYFRHYWVWFGNHCVGEGGSPWKWDYYQKAALMRLTATGQLDPTFGAGGVQTLTGGAQYTGDTIGTMFRDLKVLDSGEIAVAGAFRGTAITDTDTLYVARYSASGVLLASDSYAFNTGMYRDTRANSISIQTDGLAVVACAYWDGGWQPRVFRYDPKTWTRDATFGTGGIATIAGGGLLLKSEVLSSGKIMNVIDFNGNLTRLAQILPSNGAADTSFQGDGEITFAQSANNYNSELAVQEDGSFLVVGTTDTSGGDFDWILRRFTADGNVDSRFSQDGEQVFEPSSGLDYPEAVALGPDGKVVVAGRHNNATGGILQLRTETVANFVSATTDWSVGASMFGACLESVTSAASAWSMTGSCKASNSDPWNTIPTLSSAAGAKIATAASGVNTATARVRFGLRAAANQTPGYYLAPVTFTTVAPNV